MKLSTPSSQTNISNGETIDSFLGGKLYLIQSKSGYRFSVDAVLLADFVKPRKADVLVELGTGCGIILLILLANNDIRHAIGIEIQKELANQAIRNAGLNNAQDKMSVIIGDFRSCPLVPKCADLVICNPPYRKQRSGRINPDLQKAIARHEVMASLEDVLRTARYLLRPKGRFAMVYPAERLAHVISLLRKFQLEPKRVQIQYPALDARAKLLLIEASQGARPGLQIEPPLVGQGGYSIGPEA